MPTRRGRGQSTNSVGDHHSHHSYVRAAGSLVWAAHTRRWRTDRRSHVEAVVQHMGHHGHSHREEVGMGHQLVVEHPAHHREGVSDSVRHETRNNHVEEVGSGDDSLHDDRRSHARGVVRDDHSNHQAELHNRRRYDGVEGSVSGSDRAGLHLGSSAVVNVGFEDGRIRVTNISVAVDFGAFEVLVIEIFDCSLQVDRGFKFDESGGGVSQSLIFSRAE